VATLSTGITATWGGVAFTEIFDISAPIGGGVRKDRSLSSSTTGWTDEVGNVQVSAFGTNNMTTLEYGQRKTLVLAGGGLSLTFNACCTGVSATPELNGVTRYTFTAKLLDT
jgi:hypothetical protein